MSTVPTAAAPRRPASTHPTIPGPDDSGARIGPNAVLQTLRATREIAGEHAALAAAKRVGLPIPVPDDAMIPEAWFVALVRDLRTNLPEEQAERILRDSGRYTGEYVTANRIPAPIRVLLKALPPRLAVPLLLGAFRRHAWTFAGSGGFRVEGPYPGTLVLQGSPTCGEAGGGDPSGSYYEAAFQRLLELAAPGIRVREVACQAGGHPACRFRLHL